MAMKILFLVASLLFAPLLAANEFGIGSGNFKVPGGEGRPEKEIGIYYHVPKTWRKDSPVVLVIPGAGRNAWSYRDAWIDESENKGIIIISPSYSEEYYPRFWNYNIAGMIGNVKINASKTDFESFTVSNNPNDWIFSDFDRIFALVKSELHLSTEKYDLFGHSAGGQILHRFALFYHSDQVDRILSSNSGWYTVPDFDAEFPTGLINAPINTEQIKKSFAKKLVVFLGELDNANETRGHLVKNERMNQQGLHRLERGHFFFDAAQKQAQILAVDFAWKKVIVPGVGHDYKNMSLAASEYLYP
jgi:pimeloyl-ACP methyl ester carboxylesterase